MGNSMISLYTPSAAQIKAVSKSRHFSMFRSKVKKHSSGREFQWKIQEQKLLEIKLVSTCKCSPTEIFDVPTKKYFISSRILSLQEIGNAYHMHKCPKLQAHGLCVVKLVVIIG